MYNEPKAHGTQKAHCSVRTTAANLAVRSMCGNMPASNKGNLWRTSEQGLSLGIQGFAGRRLTPDGDEARQAKLLARFLHGVRPSLQAVLHVGLLPRGGGLLRHDLPG